MNKNKGFTLLELLVVIAMIGILSVVILAALTSSRDKAKIVSVQSIVNSVRPHAISCLDEGYELSAINSETSGGGTICDNTLSEWPPLSVGWSYDFTGLTGGVPVSDTASNTFSFTVKDNLGNSITCNETDGCVIEYAE